MKHHIHIIKHPYMLYQPKTNDAGKPPVGGSNVITVTTGISRELLKVAAERDHLREQVAYLRSVLEAIAIMARQPEVRGQFMKRGADKFWDRLIEKLIEPALRGEG